MKRIASGLVVLLASAAPALAGGDWDDDDYYYDSYHWQHDHRAYYAAPHAVYVPYGYYYADEPYFYGPDCKVEQKWKHGRYREKVECDDD